MKNFLFRCCVALFVLTGAWIVAYDRIRAAPAVPTYASIVFDEKKMADVGWLERQWIGVAIAAAEWQVTDYGVCRTAILQDEGGDIQLWQEPLTGKWRKL